MKLTPVAGPLPPPTINETARREKMISAFNKSAQQQSQPQQRQPEGHAVNPNNISPEELSAVKPQAPVQTQEKNNSAPVEATETPVPAVEPKPERDPALSQQFAKLAQQERRLRQKAQQQQEAIKAREAELATKEQAIKAKEQQYQDGYISRDQLKSDTLRILADSGVSYDELTQQILNQQPTDPRTEATIKRLEAKIASLEEKATQGTKAMEEQQQQAYRAAVKQIEMDVRSTVMNDPNFETIRSTKSVLDVVELIEETYKKDGLLMSVEEACQEVENYLVDEAMKLTRIGKIKRQLEQARTSRPSEMKTQPNPQQTQTMKTLTNAAASTRKLSAKERAILAFRGELKP